MTRRHPPIPAKVPVEWTQADDDSLRIDMRLRDYGWVVLTVLTGVMLAVCVVLLGVSVIV